MRGELSPEHAALEDSAFAPALPGELAVLRLETVLHAGSLVVQIALPGHQRHMVVPVCSPPDSRAWCRDFSNNNSTDLIITFIAFFLCHVIPHLRVHKIEKILSIEYILEKSVLKK